MNPAYLPAGVGTRMVAFCMVIDPGTDGEEGLKEQVMRVREATPETSVNHCAQRYMQRRPVAATIKTKKDDGGGDASLQLGVWCAAW